MAAAESARAAGRSFFFKEDLADLFEELRVYILALGCLEAGGDGAVSTAAAADSTAEASAEAASVSSGWAVVVVAGWGLCADASQS